jgi:hypothetical protein
VSIYLPCSFPVLCLHVLTGVRVLQYDVMPQMDSMIKLYDSNFGLGV